MPDAPRLTVTISRQLGSGGSIVGQLVAKRHDLSYVDSEILERAAKSLGVDDPRALEPLEEQASGGLWDRVSRGISFGAPECPYVPAPPGIREGHVLDAEREIIREIAAHRHAVIVGRGAAHLLSGPNILRVFIHAPRAWRVHRAAVEYHLDENAALDLVQRSDRKRAAFVQELRGRNWTDACLYDITLDTSVVGIEGAADVVAAVAAGRLQNLSR